MLVFIRFFCVAKVFNISIFANFVAKKTNNNFA